MNSNDARWLIAIKLLIIIGALVNVGLVSYLLKMIGIVFPLIVLLDLFILSGFLIYYIKRVKKCRLYVSLVDKAFTRVVDRRADGNTRHRV